MLGCPKLPGRWVVAGVLAVHGLEVSASGNPRPNGFNRRPTTTTLNSPTPAAFATRRRRRRRASQTVTAAPGGWASSPTSSASAANRSVSLSMAAPRPLDLDVELFGKRATGASQPRLHRPDRHRQLAGDLP